MIWGFASCKRRLKKHPPFRIFQDLKEAEGALPDNVSDYKIKIQPDDELIITITSSNPEATAIYNLPLGNPSIKGNISATQSPRLQTYIVDRNGMIQIPVLGEIKATGISTDELARRNQKPLERTGERPIRACGNDQLHRERDG
ncbi:MAG: polysaccharide biosynthesis/export family protein [Porphyromonadaceae bacterium]|nr:MAG: polysaccharide biosynthesis/export family protein [Porphyromonadaceae bacterium]